MTTGVVSPPLIADDRSLAERLIAPLSLLPEDERPAAFDALMADLGPTEAALLLSWEGRRRPSQTIVATPGEPFRAVTGGRGSGKTRTGAETICDRIESDDLHHGAFISRTPGDVRRVMIEGASGLKACAERRGIEVDHKPSLTRIDIKDGGTISTYSAQNPDELRGPEHDTLWGDEFAAWPPIRDDMGNTAFTNAVFGLRAGDCPLGIFTTTPKAVPNVREALENRDGLWKVVRMSMAANIANLSPGFVAMIVKMYGGTRLYAQEALGEYVEDVEGALWSTEELEFTRIHIGEEQTYRDVIPELIWPYVAVDPSVAKDGGGDECGIGAGGVAIDRRFYVTHDWSAHLSPHAWAERAIRLYHDTGAIKIIAEANNGGALVEELIRSIDPTVPVELVHASNGKRARAEPTSRLWQAVEGERPLASMVGSHPELEGELTGWDAEHSTVSPNRLDWLAWLGHKCLDHLYESAGSWSAATPARRLPV